MIKVWRRFAIGALIIASVVSAPFVGRVSGQDSTPVAISPSVGTPSPIGEAAIYLPEAIAFGDGWTVFNEYVPGADGAVFSDSSGAIYVGPAGARIKVDVYVNQPGRAALQRSWEDVTAVYDQWQTGYQPQAELDRLAAIPFPDGCVDVKRAEGDRTGFWTMPDGITLCAVDPNVTILVVAAGAVGELSGVAASDQVTSIAYATGSSRR